MVVKIWLSVTGRLGSLDSGAEMAYNNRSIMEGEGVS